MKRPTGREFDALLTRFAGLQSSAQEAAEAASEKKAAVDAVKDEIVGIVKLFGVRHAEASMRMQGERTTATVTTGRMTKQNDAAIDELRGYLEKSGIEGVSEQFFTPVTTYKLVGSPAEVVKTLSGPANVLKKIKGLVALCFEVVTKAPSLKVDVPAA
jgi:hypothetical protein